MTELSTLAYGVKERGLPASHSLVLSLVIKEKAELYAAYMPFLRHGGLFVPSQESSRMGDAVQLRLRLMDEPVDYVIAGKVAWITPSCVPHGKVAGIGVHFCADERERQLKHRIEELLGTVLSSARPTHTL